MSLSSSQSHDQAAQWHIVIFFHFHFFVIFVPFWYPAICHTHYIHTANTLKTFQRESQVVDARSWVNFFLASVTFTGSTTRYHLNIFSKGLLSHTSHFLGWFWRSYLSAEPRVNSKISDRLSPHFLLLTTRCPHIFIDYHNSVTSRPRLWTHGQSAPDTWEEVLPKQKTDTRWISQRFPWIKTQRVRKRRIRSRGRRVLVRTNLEKAAELRRRRRRWSQQLLLFPQPFVCQKSRINSEDTSCSWNSNRKKER